MRITAYSDRLIDDLELLDWPEKVKACLLYTSDAADDSWFV